MNNEFCDPDISYRLKLGRKVWVDNPTYSTLAKSEPKFRFGVKHLDVFRILETTALTLAGTSELPHSCMLTHIVDMGTV